MPTPFVHLPLAHAVAQEVGIADEHLAPFLHGSISPDVAQLVGRPRAATHFWTVEDDVSGVYKLLAAVPSLAAPGLDPPTRAFVAGYLCHLVADEQWNFVIWRPHFGRHSRYGGGPEGAALQAAFRDQLDARLHDQPPGAIAFAAWLEAAPLPNVALPFVRSDELLRNRDVVRQQVLLEPGETRARYWASVQTAPPTHALAPEQRALAGRIVAPQTIATFWQRAHTNSVGVLQDYLADRPIRLPEGTERPGTLNQSAPGAPATSTT